VLTVTTKKASTDTCDSFDKAATLHRRFKYKTVTAKPYIKSGTTKAAPRILAITPYFIEKII